MSYSILKSWASLVAQMVKKKKKKPTCNAGDPGSIPGSGDTLEKEMHHRTFKISLKLEKIHFTEITRLGQHFPTQTPTPNLLFPIASSA